MVKVKPTASQGRITVKTSNDTNVFGIKDNLSEYYAKLSEKWASSPEIVNGIDHSSKYYADKSKVYSESVEVLKNEIFEETTGFENKVRIAQNNIEENRDNSIISINNAHNNAVIDIENSSSDAINNITAMQNNVETNIANVVNGYLGAIDASVKALPMFAYIWSDHILNDVSYLRADTFSWHNAEIYKTGYSVLEEEYNNDNCILKTEDGVEYKLSPRGFKIANASQHDTIINLYENNKNAWFYIIDIENRRFKLPREKNNEKKYLYFFVGNYVRPDTEVNIGELVEIVNNRDFEGQVSDGKAELNATKNSCIQEINSTGVGSRVLKTGDTMTGNLNINKNSGVVSITGTGYKGIVTKSTDIDYTLTDQVSLQGVRILSQDKNGQWFGYFQNGIGSAGNIFTGMSARRMIDGTTKECAITCNVNSNGSVYASAPTPATGDSSTKIATTAFVNNQLNNKIKSYITETYVNGTSGYRIWSDKFCEQWGRAKPASANNGTTEVTLLKAYKNTNGMCLVTSPDITFMSGGGINYGTSSAKFIANNKIRVKQATGSPEDSNMQWYTTGYIA